MKPVLRTNILLASCCALIFPSCKKLITVNSRNTPQNSVYNITDDSTANAAVVGIYEQLSLETSSFATGRQSISLLSGLGADELESNTTDENYHQFYMDKISPTNSINQNLWAKLFKSVYQCNIVLAGIINNTSISPSFSRQLQGEALFMRAYFYFYLVNLYGDVPLAIQTNYTINDTLSRKPKTAIYDQITNDLTQATQLLEEGYIFSGERIRVNKYAAQAMLSRVYLYLGQYQQCIEQCSALISKTDEYKLCQNLDQTFLKNSSEAILQLQPVTPGYNTLDASIFILPRNGTVVSLRKDLFDIFDSVDLRVSHWIGQTNISGQLYFFPFKYKHQYGEPLQDYLMVLRLAEQFLNRAESYAKEGKLDSALKDINVIRNRAGLPSIGMTNQNTLLKVISLERQKELFTEWGHRWLDLKRTGMADSVMKRVKINWQSTDQLYPIPATEIVLNPHLSQNPGY